MKGFGARVLAGLAATMLALPAGAQTYPDRPIKLLVPLAAASAVDIVARVVGEKMGEILGERLFIENQPGAAGLIGMRAGAHSTPDGYTVIVANDSLLTMLPNIKADIGYDSFKDFTPVAKLVGIPLGLISNPDFPVKSVSDLIALAKQKPGSINYASGGVGSPQHVAMELLMRAADIKMIHVPYRGITPAVNEVVAGHVPLTFTALSAVFPLLPDRVRLLATGTAKRTARFPDVPTIAESGVPGYDFSVWCAFLVPPNTPPAIVAKLNAVTNQALSDPVVRTKLVELGFEIGGGSPDDLAAFLKTEFAKTGDMIRAANLKE